MSVQVADVSKTANTLRAIWQAAKFAPQIARKNVDAPVDRRIVAVEHSFCEVLAMNDASARVQKSGEQVKLGGSQFNKLAISSTCPRALIQREVPDLEIFRLGAGVGG